MPVIATVQFETVHNHDIFQIRDKNPKARKYVTSFIYDATILKNKIDKEEIRKTLKSLTFVFVSVFTNLPYLRSRIAIIVKE